MDILGLTFGSEQAPQGITSSPFRFATLVPGIAVGIRRMHDVGKSAWFAFIPIYDLILAATEGEAKANEYGEDPRGSVENLINEIGR